MIVRGSTNRTFFAGHDLKTTQVDPSTVPYLFEHCMTLYNDKTEQAIRTIRMNRRAVSKWWWTSLHTAPIRREINALQHFQSRFITSITTSQSTKVKKNVDNYYSQCIYLIPTNRRRTIYNIIQNVSKRNISTAIKSCATCRCSPTRSPLK